ncbi:MAG: anti-sigma factor [Candidatus Eisenbacteria bacterium]
MIPDKMIEYMNGEIDGTNSDSESAALREFLRSSEEGRRYLEGLRRIGEAFEAPESVEPPPDLREKILASAEGARTRSREGREARRLLPRSGVRSRGGLVFSFAGGALAGILLFSLLTGWIGEEARENEDRLYGTLGFLDMERDHLRPLRFENGPVVGSAWTTVSDGRRVVAIEIGAEEEVTVEVRAGEGRRFTGASFPKAGASRAEIDGERAACAVEGGSCLCVFALEESDESGSPLLLTIAGAAGTIFEDSIRTE